MLHKETLDVIPLFNVYKKVCDSCTIYILLFAIFSRTTICISIVFLFIFIVVLKRIILVLSLILILKQQFIKHIDGKYQTN